MLTTLIRQYDFNLAYANQLVIDLSEEQMTTIPADGLVNHPAFTLGHLVSGSALIVEDLGGDFDMPDGWKELFLRKGPGDPTLPIQNKAVYPTKQELISELSKQHNKVKELLKSVNLSDLEQDLKWRFSSYMPTLLDVLYFMCINHEAMHLGQLAAWRRAMNLPSALKEL